MLFTGVILEVTVLNRIEIFGAKPDILLLLTIFTGLFFGANKGFEAGMVSGFLYDIFTIDIFGINTLVYSLTGLLAGFLNTKFFKESRVMLLFLAFFTSLFSMTLHFLFAKFLSKSLYLNLSEYLKVSAVSIGVYTALASLIIFPPLLAFYRLNEDEDFL